ncbi:MAG: hypothetical protein AAF927_02340 [Bacteroidota bacterium]
MMSFTAIEKVVYSENPVQISYDAFNEIQDHAKRLQLHTLLKIKNYYGIEGTVTFYSDELVTIRNELNLLLKGSLSEPAELTVKNMITFLQQAIKDNKKVITLSD